MNSILNDGEDDPLSEEELAEVRVHAIARLRLWKRRSVWSLVAFFVACASVAPFLAGQPLHAYFKPFGTVLVTVSLALLIWLLNCALLLWSASRLALGREL